MADVVAAADVDQGLAGFPSRNGLLALVVRQFWLAAHHHPLALARSRPSLVRLRINSRSNSAKPPRTVSINLPCAVVASAQVSRSDLNPAPLSATTPIRLRRSLVDQASRSRRPKTPR